MRSKECVKRDHSRLLVSLVRAPRGVGLHAPRTTPLSSLHAQWRKKGAASANATPTRLRFDNAHGVARKKGPRAREHASRQPCHGHALEACDYRGTAVSAETQGRATTHCR